jgi:tetratricopeptide (TPR) repeat protein
MRWQVWFCSIAGVLLSVSAANATAYSADQRDCLQSEPDRRIVACTRVIANTPKVHNRMVAYDNRGNAWQNKRDYDRALADYNAAIQHGAGDASVYMIYNSRGLIWKFKGDFDRAIADFNQAIRLNPKYANAYLNRGTVWRERGDLDRSIADQSEVIRLDPKSANGYHNRATVWQEKGDLDRAIADDDEAIRLQPNDAVRYATRGLSWRLKGDLDRALADQNRAVELGPKGSLVYVFRGDTHRYRGDYASAIADYEQALRNVPDYIPAITGLGLTYERMGDSARARSQFEQANLSLSLSRFADVSKSALETARARLAALDSGAVQPVIPVSQPKAKSATSIPTPTIAPPVAAPLSKSSIAAPATKPVAQGRRVALVIGNSAYQKVPALTNPQKDAEAVAASLRNVGFETVTLAMDASREKLIDSLRTFANEAEKADWAMVYYAGHGIEVNGQNYLIPVDAKLAADRDIQFEAVPLDQVLAALEGAKKLKLVLLDACRDNPFAPQMRRTTAPDVVAAAPTAGGAVGTRSIGRGLGEVKVQGASLVVFAAKHGQTALDGEGGNSPFAVAMVQRIATPGVEINKIFRLVRDDVMEATAGRQEPYTYGSLPGKEDFFFVAAK